MNNKFRAITGSAYLLVAILFVFDSAWDAAWPTLIISSVWLASIK